MCPLAGECIPLAELDENVVKVYKQDVKLRTLEIFNPYKKLCKSREVNLSLSCTLSKGWFQCLIFIMCESMK